MVLWTEEHLVEEVVKDKCEELSRGQASDSSAEGRDSWVEVDDDLESIEDGDLDPDCGANRIGEHLFDTSITGQEASSGFSVDTLHPRWSVEVAGEGPEHHQGKVSGAIDVDGNDCRAVTATDEWDLCEDAEGAEAVVEALTVESVHLVEVHHTDSKSMRSSLWPRTSRLTPGLGDEIDEDVVEQELVVSSDFSRGRIQHWSQVSRVKVVISLSSLSPTVGLSAHAALPKSILSVDVTVDSDESELTCSLSKTKTALDHSQAKDDWINDEQIIPDLGSDDSSSSKRGSSRMSELMSGICWWRQRKPLSSGENSTVLSLYCDAEVVDDRLVSMVLPEQGPSWFITDLRVLRIQIVRSWLLPVGQDRISDRLLERGGVVPLITEAAFVVDVTVEV